MTISVKTWFQLIAAFGLFREGKTVSTYRVYGGVEELENFQIFLKSGGRRLSNTCRTCFGELVYEFEGMNRGLSVEFRESAHEILATYNA